MQTRQLGTSDLRLSVLGLGTMTWGEQNDEADAHAQLDLALERGVNFVDTAELYAVPPRPETYGLTERYIGRWLAQRGGRDRFILASKVVGKNSRFPWIRGGEAKLDAGNIIDALEASLRRLQTDYLDLYQLHWPDRPTNNFGQLGYQADSDPNADSIEPTLEVLAKLVTQGKVRHIGLSNETPWGVMRFLQLAEQRGWPRMQSIQNPYSLLNRSFEVGLAEVALRERCGLLAYSPLAMGMLSGKYSGGQRPAGARLTRFPGMSRYTSPKAHAAAERYVGLAQRYGIDAAQMALAYVNSRPFVTSNIFGATSTEQLLQNLGSAELQLPADLMTEIESVHNDIPNPCP